MPIQVTCGKCQKTLNVKDRLAGKKVRCPVCKALFAAPPLASGMPRHRVGDAITGALDMRFAWVPPGNSFLGGRGGSPGTIPFTLPEGLWCGIYPVVQAEWRQVMHYDPSGAGFAGNPRYPVQTVARYDVERFLDKLSDKHRHGYSYRLPTSHEWEYICRGGPISEDQSKYDFYFAKSKTDLTPNPTNDLSSKQANFNGRDYPGGSASKGPYLERPTDVGSYLPNPLGIYDMHGNVWEWTLSAAWSFGVLRGGCWYRAAVNCSACYDQHFGAGAPYYGVGFRLLAVPMKK